MAALNLKELAEVARKVNWPSVVLILGALLIWALFIKPDYATKDDVRSMIEKHHPQNDVRLGVTEEAINRLTEEDRQLRQDIRARTGP